MESEDKYGLYCTLLIVTEKKSTNQVAYPEKLED